MGSDRKISAKTPDVSIDEALRLFLAVTYPNGLPDGVDSEKFMAVLRKKIAADRPAWAARGDDECNGNGDSGTAGVKPEGKSYSEVKAEIVDQSRREQVPEDPEEKYFYERRKKARENRERRHAESREDTIRADLRRRLIAEKKEPDAGTLERVFRVRQALEDRVRTVLQLHGEPAGVRDRDAALALGGFTAPQSLVGAVTSTGGSLRVLGESLDVAPKPDSASDADADMEMGSLWDPTSVSRRDEIRESVKNLRSQDKKQQIETIRKFNGSQKADLKPRQDYLTERRPPGLPSRSATLTLGETLDSDAMRMAFESRADGGRENLTMTSGATIKHRGLELG